MRLHLEDLQTLVEQLPVLPGEESSNTLLIQTRNKKKFFLNGNAIKQAVLEPSVVD